MESAFPTTLQTVFATIPALVSYSDGAGHSATVSYPLPPPYTGSTPGPDRIREGFPVSADAGGDVVLTLTFWRPQRQAIAGEEGAWTDIGGLLYTAPVNFPASAGGSQRTCPSTAYSTTDGELAPDASQFPRVGFRDQAPDRAANPANRLTFSVNVTQCLAAHGLSWNPGESLELDLFGYAGGHAGSSSNDFAQQRLYFKRE